MALPKAIRVLAALTICLLFYLGAQVFRAPAEMQFPDVQFSAPKDGAPAPKKEYQEWDHDPQLDRKLQLGGLERYNVY